MRIPQPFRLAWVPFTIFFFCLVRQELLWASHVHQQIYKVQEFVSPQNEESIVDVFTEEFVNKVEKMDGMTESLRRLLSAAVSLRQRKTDLQVETTTNATKARCDRYGFNFTNQPKRRIFWGSLIADDSWHVLGIAAMEYHGLLDTIAFVESNTTQSEVPRTMRFPESSLRKDLLTSPRLWGDTTRIHVDYFFSSNATFYRKRELWRENDQRNQIFQRWKKNGMTHKDIGFISDIDEVATRDFLLALQTCDVPQFLPKHSESLLVDQPHDCLNPKVKATTIVFEGSPMCLQVPRKWKHPEFVIGECLEGIGDPRPSIPRQQKSTANQRVENWGNFVQQVPFRNTTITLGPLWDATDVRMLWGSGRMMVGTTSHGYVNMLNTGYHFHNFFDSLQVLRRKYLTYGHPKKDAMSLSLGEIQPNDVGFMVDCLMGRSTSGSKWRQAGPADWSMVDPVWGTPIAFQRVPDYRHLRHQELQKEMTQDELLYPPTLINGTFSLAQ